MAEVQKRISSKLEIEQEISRLLASAQETPLSEQGDYT